MPNAATLRRRLRTELRHARKQVGLTQREVADALDWSPSKVLRIEGGQVAVSTTDLMALLRLYKVHDQDLIDKLTSMARQSKRQSWSQYRDVISSETADYFGYEASASIIRHFEPLIVPGLLQMKSYTRALLKNAYRTDDSIVERHIEARIERQELFEREEPPETFFIIGEPVIRQMVGSPQVMREQLERLLELGAGAATSIQVVPFSSNAHVGLRGPFALLDFSDEEGPPDVLYLEGQSDSGALPEGDERTNQYLNYFWDLEALALSKNESAELIASALKHLNV